MPRKGYRTCARCGKSRAERFFTGPRGRICETCRKKTRSKASHEARVTATYGLGPGEYDLLFEAQGGVCAGCQQPRRERLSVDHCHKTNLVRGLLCRRCNGHVLPYSKDSPETLRRLADYLENPPALRILGERYYQGDDKPRKSKRRKRNGVSGA